MIESGGLDLSEVFVVLSPDKKATPEAITATFYEDIDIKYNDFKGHELISAYEFNKDWPTWEVHPKGDEIVILMSGRATMVLDAKNGQKFITLEKPGAYVIVPKNTWHTAKISEKTKMLFVTPGEGTLNKGV